MQPDKNPQFTNNFLSFQNRQMNKVINCIRKIFQMSYNRKFFIYVLIMIFIFQVGSIPNINSIQTEYFKYNEFQTCNFLISKDNYPLWISTTSDTNSYLYTVLLTRARTTTLTENTITYGIYQFSYDIDFYWNNDPDEYRQKMSFSINIQNFTNSGFQIELYRPYGRLQSIKVSFFIWDSTFRYANMFQTYIITFVQGNLNQEQNIGFDYRISRIIPFLKLMSVTSNNARFGYRQSRLVGSTNNSFAATINDYGSYRYFQVQIKYLVMNFGMLMLRDHEIYTPSQTYDISSPSSSWSFSNYVPYYSYIMYGLEYFQYDITNHGTFFDLWFGFQLQSSFDQFLYNLDNGFQTLRFNLVMLTFKKCNDPDYPILFRNVNTSQLECFNQCYDGYYLIYTSDNEYQCNQCSYKCILCDQASACTTCATEFEMDSNGTCQLRKQYFSSASNSADIHPCTYNSNLTNCLQCQANGYYCQKCDLSYYLDTNNLCQPCNSHFPNCINCTISECYECASPLTLLNTTYCDNPANSSTVSRLLPCKDIRCASCLQSALDDCLRCYDSNLVIKNGYCVNNCGNGLIYQNDSDSDTQVCDDGNSIDFDGCSSDCSKLQQGFQCMNTSLIPNTTCYYAQPITLTLISTRKILRQNKVELILRNSAPNILVWSTFDMSALKQILTLKVPNMEVDEKGYTFQYTVKFINYNNIRNARLLQSNQSFDGSLYEYLFVEVYYTPTVTPGVSLNNQMVQITFSPNISRMLIFNINSSYYTPPSLVRFSLNSDDSFLVQYFSPDYLSSCQTIEVFSIVISILTLIMIGIAVIAQFLDGINAKQMITTIQTTCIVQFTYFSLLGIGPMNPMFVSMAQGLKYTSGFDINLSDSKTKIKQLIGINIQSGNIEGNVNLSVIFPLIFVIVGLALSLAKRLREKKSHTIQQNYDNIETIEKKQQPQNNLKQKAEQKMENSQSLVQKPQNLIANFGFCLFIFFLYKYFVFTFIQVVQNMDQIQFIGILVMGFVGFLLFFFIFTLFRKFEFYQNMAQKMSYIKPLPISKQTILRNYFLLFIFERLINSFDVVVLGSLAFNGFIPLLIYFLKEVFIYKYLQNIYHPSHKIRLYLTYLFGLTIEVLLITRRIFIESTIKEEGGEQSTFGLYLPYSILILLLIILLKGITFQIYSIKRIRCCKLDVEWQNQAKNKKQKVKPLSNIQVFQDKQSDQKVKNSNFHEKLGQKFNNYQDHPSINKKLLYSTKNIYSTRKTNKLLQQKLQTNPQTSKKLKQEYNNKQNQYNQQNQYNEQQIIKKIRNQNEQKINLIHNNNIYNSTNKNQNKNKQSQQQSHTQKQISQAESQSFEQNQNSQDHEQQSAQKHKQIYNYDHKNKNSFSNNMNNSNDKTTSNKTMIKKEIKNELEKLKLTKQQKQKLYKNKKNNHKLNGKINYRINQTNQQQKEEDMSYFGLNKKKENTDYKYTDIKRYHVTDQYDMI